MSPESSVMETGPAVTVLTCAVGDALALRFRRLWGKLTTGLQPQLPEHKLEEGLLALAQHIKLAIVYLQAQQ